MTTTQSRCTGPGVVTECDKRWVKNQLCHVFEGGGIPYITYTSMCRAKGYDF